MNEHDDELDTASVGTTSSDAARIADAIAIGFERIANAIEGGFRELAEERRGGSTRKRPRADRG